MAADAKSFFRWAAQARERQRAEANIYLTDIPTFAKADGVNCAVVEADEAEMMGVNCRAELAACRSARCSSACARSALDDGVGMIAPETVYLSPRHGARSRCRRSGPMSCSAPASRCAAAREIKAIPHLEGADVGKGAIVGPYARLRPGAVIGEDAHIGNFVEVKNARD